MNSRFAAFGASLALALLLAACGRNEPAATPAAPAAARTIVIDGPDSGLRVNGEAIPAALLDTYAARRGYDLKDPDQVKLAQEQLVTLVALAQAAVRSGALTRPEVELDRLDLLSGVTIASGLQDQPPLDEATLRARYDEQLEQIGTQEYKVRHLLLRNGALAEQAAALLAGGASFDAMLASFQGNPEIPAPRDLGWIHLGRIPPQDAALAQAIRATPAGSSSQAPIATPSGWHLVEVQEVRPFTPPGFDALKDGIRQNEERSRRETLIQGIRAAAQVEGLK